MRGMKKRHVMTNAAIEGWQLKREEGMRPPRERGQKTKADTEGCSTPGSRRGREAGEAKGRLHGGGLGMSMSRKPQSSICQAGTSSTPTKLRHRGSGKATRGLSAGPAAGPAFFRPVAPSAGMRLSRHKPHLGAGHLPAGPAPSLPSPRVTPP